MRPIHWFTGGAMALRRFMVRVHHRTRNLPALPFGVAVGVALVLLLVALEGDIERSTEVREVDELANLDLGSLYENELTELPAELEILESGFGVVTDAQGAQRLSVGAVLRNPHEDEIAWASLSLTGLDDDGERRTIEQVSLGAVQAGSQVLFGHVASNKDAVTAEEVRLELDEAVRWQFTEPPGDEARALFEEQWAVAAPPEVAVVETVPLFSPEGWRVTYMVDSEHGASNFANGTQLYVIYRDGEGRIIGGMTAWGDPFARPELEFGYTPGFHAVPPGESRQYLDLPASWIPEGADPDMIEIGPGR